MFFRKISGYERRWGLEEKGFTKEGFFGVFRRRFGLDCDRGLLMELAVGDGLVGSLGVWMEGGNGGWKIEAWEHRPDPAESFRQNCPTTLMHLGRLTSWSDGEHLKNPTAITLRGVREAAGVCREIRRGRIAPRWVGFWNPHRRSIWYHRMRREGYRLACVWHNMEFYWRSGT